MFDIAKKMIFSRKKWMLVIVLSLSVMLSGLFAILFASETIKANLKENAFNNYGEHTGTLINIPSKDRRVLNNFEKFGTFSITDTIKLKSGKLVTSGWFNQNAIKLGRIKLIEGSFPKSNNEVVIEASYKKLIEQESGEKWSVGESRVLNFSKGKKIVLLSGVVKNYSSNWSVPLQVKIGNNNFPNIISTPTDSSNLSYIFKTGNNFTNMITETEEITQKYGDKGFLNSRLLFIGLGDYDLISNLSLVFQLIITVLSFVSIITLISFYTTKTRKKIAIFKSTGAKNNQIKLILNLQNFVLLCMGVLLSIPLAILFSYIIISNTYKGGTLENLNWLLILSMMILVIFVTWITLVVKVRFELKNLQDTSINSLLKGEKKEISKIQTKYFWLKQISIQIMTYKKMTILTIMTLTLSMLVILMSLFLQNETKGIWDTDIDYYVASQESYTFDMVDNLTVLKEKGITFSRNEINSIEIDSNVKSIEKIPFMPDVHLLVDLDDSIMPLKSWIGLKGGKNITYDGMNVVPNVEYRILNRNEFEKKFPKDSFDDFKEKAVLSIPAVNQVKTEYRSAKVEFIKMFVTGETTKVKRWNYPIYKVITSKNKEDSENILIYLSEDSAKEKGIFNGYRELNIILKSKATSVQKANVEKKIDKLVSTTPGSLYQKISSAQNNEARISDYLGFLGKFSFFVAVALGLISTLTLIYGKYNSQKLYWGTYMATGMSRNKVIKYLAIELIYYFTVASFISGILFILLATLMGHKYTLLFYSVVYIQVIIFIFVLLCVGIYLLNILTKQHTIYSMLRGEE